MSSNFRTDRNNNPAAFTVNIAQQAGLHVGIDYEQGDPFFDHGHQYFTARLLRDPIALTIKVIDAIGYFTHTGIPRWSYIQIPSFVWHMLTDSQKKEVIAFHYKCEGGTALSPLFSNPTGHIAIGISDKIDISGT